MLNANGGDDTLGCAGNLAALIRITADGGPGNDRLRGGNGPDVLIGGEGNDFIDGNQGSDTILLGDGDDVFQWDPGDGNDAVEGQGGHDVIIFNGSSIGETLEFSANPGAPGRLRFTRNIGIVALDADGVEQFDLHTLGGADTVIVNDLTGTDLIEVNLELAGTVGGVSGDAQPDAVTVNGTPLPDTIHVAANSGVVEVSGLAAFVRILHAEPESDALTVNGQGGENTITTDTEVADLIILTVNP